MRLLDLIARLTDRIYFVYFDKASGRWRLYFDKLDRDVCEGFLSFLWRAPR